MTIIDFLEDNAKKYGTEEWLVEINPQKKPEHYRTWREFSLVEPGLAKEYRRSIGDSKTAGRNAGDPGKATGRDRGIVPRKEFIGRAAGRIAAIKRTVLETEHEIAATDKRIEELKEMIKDKEVSIYERFKKLQNRRISRHDGGYADSVGKTDPRVLRSTREDIGSFLRELDSQERASEEKRDHSISERENRETQQERSQLEEKQRDNGGRNETQKRSGGHEINL